jgi:hypothetical protein
MSNRRTHVKIKQAIRNTNQTHKEFKVKLHINEAVSSLLYVPSPTKSKPQQCDPSLKFLYSGHHIKHDRL